MKKQKYTLHFKGGKITVWAFNYEQARILAQAEAIQKGWDYTIVNNIDINDKKVLDVVDANTHHICKYCGEVAEGIDEDVLCPECREIFGHAFYSEL